MEQAADVGPMFKVMKHLLRYMKNIKSCQSPIYQRILDELNTLQKPVSPNDSRVLYLNSHKKNAIVSSLSKLPQAMGTAFTPDIIISAFEDNGQIDRVEGVLPSIQAMINTYRGSINDEHYLSNQQAIIRTYYKEVYANGMIKESSFDRDGVVTDTDSSGKFVNRDFSIKKENCQRAKVLSSKVQREERLALIAQMKLEEEETKLKLYLTENTKYNNNKNCENRVTAMYVLLQEQKIKSETEAVITTTTRDPSLSFADILPLISEDLFGSDIHKGHAKCKPTIPQLQAFVQLREPITKFKGRSPQYKSIGKDRSIIIKECIRVKDLPLQPRQFIDPRIKKDE